MNEIIVQANLYRDYDEQHDILQDLPGVESVELVIGIQSDEWRLELSQPLSAWEVYEALDGAGPKTQPIWTADVYEVRMALHYMSIQARINEVNFDG